MTETTKKPEVTTEQPKAAAETSFARTFFRQIAGVIAAIAFGCAVFAIFGLFKMEDRYTLALVFFIGGYLFTTVALTGRLTMHNATSSTMNARTNLLLAMVCLLIVAQGATQVLEANQTKVLLGYLEIILGGVGCIGGLVDFIRLRTLEGK